MKGLEAKRPKSDLFCNWVIFNNLSEISTDRSGHICHSVQYHHYFLLIVKP